MDRARSYLSLICFALLLAPASGFAADGPANAPDPPNQAAGAPPSPATGPRGWVGKFSGPYRRREIPPPSLGNSNRLESLLRAGNLYLSLQDCIALALENNLDIQIQRYGPQLADAAELAAAAGGAARGVSTSITAGPSSSSVSSTGTTGGTPGAAAGASAGSTTAVGASVIQSSGPAIPSLDPMLVGNVSWAHATTPQSSAFTTGTNFLITRQDTDGLSVQKGFLTGATMSLGLSNNTVTNNSLRGDFNPATSGSLSFTISQHLLQGFGGVNSRSRRNHESGPEQQHRHEQQPARGLQPGHEWLPVLHYFATSVAGFRGGELPSDPHRQKQPRGGGPHRPTPGGHHGRRRDGVVLGPGGVQQGGAGGAGRSGGLAEAARGQQEAGGGGDPCADRSRKRRSANRYQRAGPGRSPDPRVAAGDHHQDRAQQDRRGEPLGRRCAHHSHGLDPDARRGAGLAGSGNDGAGAGLAPRAGPEPGAAQESGAHHERVEELPAAHPGRSRQPGQQRAGRAGEPLAGADRNGP